MASIHSAGESPFILDAITSEVYSPENPPKDWADAAFLVPHEALRLELAAMEVSTAALKDNYDKNEAWKIIYFAEWCTEDLSKNFHNHHYNEEVIYFPWVGTRAELPKKELSNTHRELIESLHEIEGICDSIKKKKGIQCTDEIEELKYKIPPFVTDMLEHLKEEEETFPALLRANFTEGENTAVVEKIVKAEGLEGARRFLPSILTAMERWAKPSFIQEFRGTIPPPIRKLLDDYYMPDYLEFTCPKRDAPTLAEKPLLPKVKCCKLPFCCNCIC